MLLRPPSAGLKASRGAEGGPRGASIIPWKRLITRLTTQTPRRTGSGTGWYEFTQTKVRTRAARVPISWPSECVGSGINTCELLGRGRYSS